MSNKLDLFRSLLFTALLCMLIWDAWLWLTSPTHQLPEANREILLTGLLLWFVSLLLNTNRDDDWAGEF